MWSQIFFQKAHSLPSVWFSRLETACRAPIPYWDSGLDHDMADPTMSILWSDQFFGNGDGEVMNGPFRNMRTILGTPIIRNYGTGQCFDLRKYFVLCNV